MGLSGQRVWNHFCGMIQVQVSKTTKDGVLTTTPWQVTGGFDPKADPMAVVCCAMMAVTWTQMDVEHLPVRQVETEAMAGPERMR